MILFQRGMETELSVTGCCLGELDNGNSIEAREQELLSGLLRPFLLPAAGQVQVGMGPLGSIC